MDDDDTYAAYQRELAPYRDDYLSQVNAAWAVYLASIARRMAGARRADRADSGLMHLPDSPCGETTVDK